MNSPSVTKALTLACLIGLSLPLACGDDDDSNPNTGGTSSVGGSGGQNGNTGGRAGSSSTGGGGGTSSAGRGGSGGAPLPDGLSNMPSTKECGAETCDSASAVTVYVDPCCATGDVCGLSTGFLALVGASFAETCQPLAQPGDEDERCPSATGLQVPAGSLMVDLDPLPGCCREDGSCGVVVDDVTAGQGRIPVGSFGLGCVEGAPFFEGKKTSCSEGAAGGGAGGAAGAGGVPSTDAGGAGAGAGGSP